MAKKGKSEPAAVNDEKPLPEVRPGTSGTEALLVTNRRQASANFQRAARAEKAYRAKKRSAAARNDFKDAKGHLKESVRLFKLGMKMIFGVVKSVPYIIGEKREEARQKGDEKKRQRDLEKKKKLEERLAKEAADAESLGNDQPSAST